MTEAEWLAAEPTAMLAFVKRRVHERKLRLFACACCRRIWTVLRDKAGRAAVDVAERFADGAATAKNLRAACRAAARATADYDPMDGLAAHRADQAVTAAMNAAAGWSQTLYAAECAVSAASAGAGARAERTAQAAILRDIFGNPFRPVAFEAAWRTPTAVGLAQTIYDERAFDRLPILADALQDAGCEDADVLAHCRGDGPHVRGCWVVDLVLGKS